MRWEVKILQKRRQTADRRYGVGEYQGAHVGVVEQEGIEIEILISRVSKGQKGKN